MKPQIPWLRVFVEGVVIVGSILLAFGIDAWWEGRQERSQELAALRSLQAEFVQVQADLESRLAFHTRIAGSLTNTLASLRSARSEGLSEVLLPDTALAWSYVAPTTQLSLGTVDGLIQSGRLGILRDPELVGALSGWRRLLDEMTEGEQLSSQYAHGQLGPVLRTRADVSPFADNELVSRLLEGDLPSESASRQSVVPADLEVIGVHAGRLAIIGHLIDEFRPVQDEADRILKLVEGSIRR